MSIHGSFFLLIFIFALAKSEITCRDEDGNPVDWFVVYKLPKIKHDPNKLVADGIGYFYMDSLRPEMFLSNRNLSEKNNCIARTLRSVYEASSDVGYILYNDQIPGGNYSLVYGHTKGDLALDKKSGWWLIHSLPHFPPVAVEGYSLPHNAKYYGQTFLCLTLDVDQYTTVGQHLFYSYPWAYDYRLPTWMKSRFPDLLAVAQKKHVGSPPYYHVGKLSTRDGLNFHTFAKSSKWGKDIYHDLVAPTLGVPLKVETWRHDRNKLPSNCSDPYPVYNVHKIDFNVRPDISFTFEKDHSKWAITAESHFASRANQSAIANPYSWRTDFRNWPTETNYEPWTCIGGINREASQFRRGGGTACTDSHPIWTEFNRIVAKTEGCH